MRIYGLPASVFVARRQKVTCTFPKTLPDSSFQHPSGKCLGAFRPFQSLSNTTTKDLWSGITTHHVMGPRSHSAAFVARRKKIPCTFWKDPSKRLIPNLFKKMSWHLSAPSTTSQYEYVILLNLLCYCHHMRCSHAAAWPACFALGATIPMFK